MKNDPVISEFISNLEDWCKWFESEGDAEISKESFDGLRSKIDQLLAAIGRCAGGLDE